jgi:hypothetical protein
VLEAIHETPSPFILREALANSLETSDLFHGEKERVKWGAQVEQRAMQTLLFQSTELKAAAPATNASK